VSLYLGGGAHAEVSGVVKACGHEISAFGFCGVENGGHRGVTKVGQVLLRKFTAVVDPSEELEEGLVKNVLDNHDVGLNIREEVGGIPTVGRELGLIRYHPSKHPRSTWCSNHLPSTVSSVTFKPLS
jgi:hypothetical protein